MLEFCLLTLPWMADPALASLENPVGGNSVATCARPAVLVIKPDQTSASSSLTATDAKTVNRWLNRWEKATRNNPDRSRSEQDEFRQRIHESFNEHTLAAVEQFVGHIRVNQLKTSFDWRIVESNLNEVCLEAIPRDELERLFYGSLRVSLNSASGNPQKLVVVGRNQLQRTVWQSDFHSAELPIQMVHFENDVPPAPNSLVRTADVRAK